MNKPDPDVNVGMTDVWNNLRIFCVGNKDTIKFQSDFFEPMGQPVHKYKKRTGYLDKGVVNLEINTAITDLLPQSSFLRENIAINALREEYIKWYISKEL